MSSIAKMLNEIMGINDAEVCVNDIYWKRYDHDVEVSFDVEENDFCVDDVFINLMRRYKALRDLNPDVKVTKNIDKNDFYTMYILSDGAKSVFCRTQGNVTQAVKNMVYFYLCGDANKFTEFDNINEVRVKTIGYCRGIFGRNAKRMLRDYEAGGAALVLNKCETDVNACVVKTDNGQELRINDENVLMRKIGSTIILSMSNDYEVIIQKKGSSNINGNNNGWMWKNMKSKKLK